jgi:hypothetical protein
MTIFADLPAGRMPNAAEPLPVICGSCNPAARKRSRSEARCLFRLPSASSNVFPSLRPTSAVTHRAQELVNLSLAFHAVSHISRVDPAIGERGGNFSSAGRQSPHEMGVSNAMAEDISASQPERRPPIRQKVHPLRAGPRTAQGPVPAEVHTGERVPQGAGGSHSRHRAAPPPGCACRGGSRPRGMPNVSRMRSAATRTRLARPWDRSTSANRTGLPAGTRPTGRKVRWSGERDV